MNEELNNIYAERLKELPQVVANLLKNNDFNKLLFILNYEIRQLTMNEDISKKFIQDEINKRKALPNMIDAIILDGEKEKVDEVFKDGFDIEE